MRQDGNHTERFILAGGCQALLGRNLCHFWRWNIVSQFLECPIDNVVTSASAIVILYRVAVLLARREILDGRIAFDLILTRLIGNSNRISRLTSNASREVEARDLLLTCLRWRLRHLASLCLSVRWPPPPIRARDFCNDRTKEHKIQSATCPLNSKLFCQSSHLSVLQHLWHLYSTNTLLS